MKKQLITAGLVASTVGTIGILGATNASAESGTSANTNPMDSLVTKIAEKFKLDKTQVQSVFDEDRTAREAEREQQVKDEVAQLIKDGKLAQEQADKINAKRSELEKQRATERAGMQNKTDAERQTIMEQHRSAIDTWLKENNISTDYAYLLHVGGRGHGQGGDHEGRRGQRMRGVQNSQNTSSTTQ